MKLKITFLIILAIGLAFILMYKVERDPQKALDYIETGKDYFGKGEFDKAIEAYKQSTKYDPGSSDAWNGLGIAYRRKYQSSREKTYNQREIGAFKNAIKADPKNWLPYINLGSTLYYTGKKKEAAEYLTKALEINPHHTEAAHIAKMIQEGLKEK